ncbi:MAG: CHAT domain-containing protein [Magnetococcus sp. MYC-9]
MILNMENDTLYFNSIERRPLATKEIARFGAWAQCYDAALNANDPSAFHGLGREIFDWLNHSDWLTRALEQESGPLEMEFAAPLRPNAAQQAFLEVPWELLATKKGGFLAADAVRPFLLVRRLGKKKAPRQPIHRDLHLLFMAASPRAVTPVLDYEAEEAGIIRQTRRLPLRLTVEESGCLTFLSETAHAQPAPAEVIHISCHGDIHDDQPVLLLEDEAGNSSRVTGAELAHALSGDARPMLLFLSACRTAEGRQIGTSLAMTMVQAGSPHVVGWNGSVSDQDAAEFAGCFYQELSKHENMVRAAATARRQLLERSPADRANHWHLARLIVGSDGGGAICTAAGRRRDLPRDAGAQVFLDRKKNQVPVAPRETFVGRRRLLQRIIADFRAGEHRGVMLYGMGHVGKSSLAARLANRLPHYQTVVVYRYYDRMAVLEAVLSGLPAEDAERMRDVWWDRVQRNERSLQPALQAILDGPARYADGDRKPLLLVIDDVERIQVEPDGARSHTPFQIAHQPVMRAILEAFRDAESDSRLLFTTRYRFTLTAGSGDELADLLRQESLSPLSEREQDKQWEAEIRHAGAVVPDETLFARIRQAARGNPGLQNLLSRPLLTGDGQAARRALEQVEGYLETGTIPTGQDAGDFFQRVALESYRRALTPEQQNAFRVLALFRTPVPIPVADAVLAAATVANPADTRARLLGLGMLNLDEVLGRLPHVEVEPLTRPLFSPWPEAEHASLAGVAVAPLIEAWREPDGTLPWHPLSLELFRLASLARDGKAMAEAAEAAGFWLFWNRHDAGAPLRMVQETLALLESSGLEPRPGLLTLGVQCAERLGDTFTRRALLEKGLSLTQANDREMAFLKGEYADLLVQQGESDEALRIRREEELPVYERLGDIRSRAVTMGKIADILQQRGESDEALRIRREEALPVYERLGDIRERAVTMGKIADILQQRGESDEALRILREEALPVYERLGDQSGLAHALFRMAQIRLSSGRNIDSASLPDILSDMEKSFAICFRIRKVDGVAFVGHFFGQLLAELGAQEAALTVLREARKAFQTLKHAQGLHATDALIREMESGMGET